MKRLDFAHDQNWEPLPIMEPNRIGDYVEYEEAMAEIERLRREVDVLRIYGDKDCTAMADEALEEK